jgi:hypothetical protein
MVYENRTKISSPNIIKNTAVKAVLARFLVSYIWNMVGGVFMHNHPEVRRLDFYKPPVCLYFGPVTDSNSWAVS